MHRRRPSLDLNHAAIVADAKRFGYSVYDGASVGGGASDLIITNRKKVTILFEIKNGERRSIFYLGQIEFLAGWVGHAAIAETFDDVQRAFEDPAGNCLSDEQKERLRRFAFNERLEVQRRDPNRKLNRHQVTWARLKTILDGTEKK